MLSENAEQSSANEKSRLIIWEHCFLALAGFFIGLCAASVIAIFRIAVTAMLDFILAWNAPDHRTIFGTALWIVFAIAAALLTGWLARNPAIRFGGEAWILSAIKEGQPRVVKTILVPKFIASWLVLASGVSVGSEGPSIQIGAATAMAVGKLRQESLLNRRLYILAGCAAGLGGAFSAPFSGICYVYEVMRERFSPKLFGLLLAGSLGVYAGCTLLFGLGTFLPVDGAFMPDFRGLCALLPLTVLAGGVGIAYNYLLRISKKLYASQKAVPALFQPLFSFGATAFIILSLPALSGGGLSIFTAIEAGHTTLHFLCFFLLAKLILTAFCYGSAIPAGIMVPVLCLGGVMGGIYADWIQLLGISTSALAPTCIVTGMAGAFAAAERAPLTAMVLVAEMTGAWTAGLALLFTGAVCSMLARLARVKSV